MKANKTRAIVIRWRHALRILLAALLAGFASLSWAGDHVVERAFLEDPSGNLTLTQVQLPTQVWTPFKRGLGKGYTTSAIWFRLRIDPGAPPHIAQSPSPRKYQTGTEQLILRIRPAMLDEITLFDPLDPSAQPRVSGDRAPWHTVEYQSLNFNFVIPRGHVPRTLWLRVKTTSASLFFVEAYDQGELNTIDRRSELAHSGLLAFLMMFLVWGLTHWAVGRDRLVGAYVVEKTVGIGLTLATTGYLHLFGSDWVTPGWVDQITNFFILAYAAAMVWFDYQLLRDYRPPKWGLRLLQLALCLFPCLVLLLWLGEVSLALRVNSVIFLLTPLLALWLVLKFKPSTEDMGDPAPVVSKYVLAAVFAVFSALYSVPSLVSLGIINRPNSFIFIVQLHGLFTGMAMLVVLQVRAHRMEMRRLKILADLSLASQQAQQERLQRLEQSRFMTMLTHELKTPLSIIRLVLGSKAPTPMLLTHAKSAVYDMNNVIERCHQAGQLADGQFKVENTAINLRDELTQLIRNCPHPECVHLDIQADVVLQTDAKLLRIVLSNLLDNAVKYSQVGSVIDILIAPDTINMGTGVTISVQNVPGAAGWPDATKVFQKYYRSPHAHHQSGSGLGLYLVHSMAQLLGGELCYAPDEIFIRFRLWLPL